MRVEYHEGVPPEGYDEHIGQYGNIFQSAQWAGAWGAAMGATPRYLILFDEAQGIRASLAFFRYRHNIWRIPIPYIRYYAKGGPVCSDEGGYSSVLKALLDRAHREHVQSISLDSGYVANDTREEHQRAGFETVTRYYFLLDMRETTDALWRELHQKVRNTVRRAQEKGIEIVEVEGDDLLYESWRLRRETAERGSVSFLPFQVTRDFFTPLHEAGLAKAYLARIPDGAFISTITLLIWNEQAFYYQTGSAAEYYGYNASDLLLWNTIEMLKDRDIAYLNMMDAQPSPRTKKEEGILLFKRRWAGKGSKPIEHYQYRWDSGLAKWLRKTGLRTK